MSDSHILSFGSYQLDLAQEQLRRDTHPVRLTPKAFQVLSYVVDRRGQLVTKEELFRVLWADTVVGDAALTMCIQEIRKALQDDAKSPRYLATVHRRGFRFLAAVEEYSPALPGALRQAQGDRENEQTTEPQPFVLSPSTDSGQTPAGIQGPKAQAASEPPWIPAFAGMTPPPSFSQNNVDGGQESAPSPLSSHPERPLDASTLPARRSWSVRSLMVMGLVLLVGVLLTVQYLSLPTSSTQPLTPNTQSLPLPDKPSIIVLPFTNLSGDPGQEYFSDGLTEILTTDLSQISSLFVIARHSAFTYKGKAAKVQDVSREMGVRYVLEGGVLRTEGQVRITAQLIDAVTGYHLWAERYDRPFGEIFALQDEIVQKIVTTLNLQIAVQEQGIPVRKTTTNLEAYDAFLRGVEYRWRNTKEAVVQARQMYEKAIALDPQYAEAYAALGGAYYIEWLWRWSEDPQTLERAFELAQQALALDDSLPLAHSLLGMVYGLQQQYDQAIAEGERAIALDPNNADSHVRQAEVLNYAGRPEEALRALEQARRLNPRSPPLYLVELGFAYRLTGRYTEAIATMKELISRSPNFMTAHFNLAASYVEQWLSQQSPTAQTLEPALAAIQRALALNDSFHWNHIVLGYIALYQQQYDQALAEMESAVVLAPTEAWSYAALAEVLSSMGRTEDALEAAAQALHLKSALADGHLASVGSAYMVAGRYEEARIPLQRYCNRYPNLLHGHLWLALVYSELGKEAEARAEMEEVLRLNPKFSLEVHRQRLPIKDPVVLERRIAALRKAGLK